MKTEKNIHEMSNVLNANPLKATVRLPIWAAIAMSISLGSVTQTARAEKTAGVENATSGEQISQMDRKFESVAKPTDGKGALPTFAEADVNGDNYITKDELKNYPNLLQVFDKIDAGKDGKLEQHEYQNLEMETKREGQIR